mgnify:CR=1 FL=1|tara:strand:- start:243 stop:644 length:402 start_codon:yes stop_codon:yes gene_type:complete
MSAKDIDISKLEDLDKFRSAPKLNKQQYEILYNQVEDILYDADWLTIGVMSPSLKIGINAVRRIEENFNYNPMKCISLPNGNGPIFLKANQKTGEIHARIEHGLGEGILISCHHENESLFTRTIGPFPLDFFN